VDLIMGPTRNHIFRYRQDPLPTFHHTAFFALCGYRTLDEERFNNTEWEERPICLKCRTSPEGKLAMKATQ
jgi:hypothetical protein